MTINLRFDSSNREHTRMTLFVNGKNSGSICMSPAEAVKLSYVLRKGAKHLNAEDGPARFESTGELQALPNITQDQIAKA